MAAEGSFLIDKEIDLKNRDTKANSMTTILGVGIVPDYTYPVCHERFFHQEI
jgi:hypothetical protein